MFRFYSLWSYFSTTVDCRGVIYTESWQKQLCFVEWSHWNPASVHYLLFFLISSDAHQHIFLISLQWGIFKKHHKFRHKITNNKIAKKYSAIFFSSLLLNWIIKVPTGFNISEGWSGSILSINGRSEYKVSQLYICLLYEVFGREHSLWNLIDYCYYIYCLKFFS